MIIATKNQGKVREIRRALKGLGLRIHGLDPSSGDFKVKEDGKSYTENAFKKARYWSKSSTKVTVADDSGLEVDMLGGLPGIRSARYAGENATDS